MLAPSRLSAAPESAVALVIGNSAYRFAPELRNPRNDAADVAAVLRQLGFRVFEGLDLDKSAFGNTIRAFADALVGVDNAVFFYAGHGLQVSEQNYLVPVDAKLATPTDLDFEVVRLDVIQRAMERSAKANVLFIDACRDNPLARTLAGAMGNRSAQVGRGMAASTSSLGTLISFSTQPGNVALDGEGRNSPFAAALKQHLASPGDDLSTILINVRNDVVRATAAQQVPWEHSSLWARFYFRPPVIAATSARPAALNQEQQAELAQWNSVRTSADRAALKTYLDRYPQGSHAVLAKMFLVRLERWDDGVGQRVAGSRQGGDSQFSFSPTSDGLPRSGPIDRMRCQRLYSQLTERAQQVRQHCGYVRREVSR
ncbi:MAG TPA: caspase domain-containing protein [Hyphomicrobiaceae bacterium]|nr:caspase domain-containing protein [Hyphomicrobiaceae bacterium]